MVNDCPAWLLIWSTWLKPPAGDRNRRKATVKKNEETQFGIPLSFLCARFRVFFLIAAGGYLV